MPAQSGSRRCDRFGAATCRHSVKAAVANEPATGPVNMDQSGISRRRHRELSPTVGRRVSEGQPAEGRRHGAAAPAHAGRARRVRVGSSSERHGRPTVGHCAASLIKGQRRLRCRLLPHLGPHSPTEPATPKPTGQSPRAAVPISKAHAEASRSSPVFDARRARRNLPSMSPGRMLSGVE